MFGNVMLEAIVDNFSCLLEPRNPFADLHVDVSVVGEGVEIILGDDLVGDKSGGEAHIFEGWHGRHVVIFSPPWL